MWPWEDTAYTPVACVDISLQQALMHRVHDQQSDRDLIGTGVRQQQVWSRREKRSAETGNGRRVRGAISPCFGPPPVGPTSPERTRPPALDARPTRKSVPGTRLVDAPLFPAGPCLRMPPASGTCVLLYAGRGAPGF